MTSPTVVFDGQVFAEQAHGGVTRYFTSLIDGLSRSGRWSPAIYAPFVRAPVPPAARRVGPSLALPNIQRGFRLMRKANEVLTPVFVRTDARTVYHPTWHHVPTVNRFGDLPMVFTVMDMIPERYPEVSTPEQLEHRAVMFERADALIAISHATRDLLVSMFPDTASKTAVVPIPVAHEPLAEVSDLATGRYFVYIGKRGSYKGFKTAIDALPLTSGDITIVFVGGGPLEDGLNERAERYGVAQRLVHEAAPDDERLGQLLAGSSGLISTSLEEGFGLPPLEALRQGTRAIIADIPVYRELYGQVADFFAPKSPAELAARMNETAGVPAERFGDRLWQRLGWKTPDQIVGDLEAVYQKALTR